MNKSLRLIVVLTSVSLVSGFILAILNKYTAPRIELNQNKALSEAVGFVIPDKKTCDVRVIEGLSFYIGKDAKGQIAGIAFVAEGDGFQSRLKIIVGMDARFEKIVKIKVLQQAETPGLGTKIDNDPTNKTNPRWFSEQFCDLAVGKDITYVKNQTADKGKSQIQAITGATISSKAVVDIINQAIKTNRAVYLSKVN